MSVRKAIYDLLNDSEADVYPYVAPQELADPYVVWTISQTPVRTQDGIGVTEVTLSVTCFGNTRALTITLADTMYAGLEAAEGTYSDKTLMICNWVSERGHYIEELDKYAITQEYELKFI